MFVESAVFPAQSIGQMGVYFVDWPLAMGTGLVELILKQVQPLVVVWPVFPIAIHRYSFQYRFPL